MYSTTAAVSVGMTVMLEGSSMTLSSQPAPASTPNRTNMWKSAMRQRCAPSRSSTRRKFSWHASSVSRSSRTVISCTQTSCTWTSSHS
eukprot:3398019-Rhodomonas_salina.1